MKIKISKLVLSIGCGGRDPKQINLIKEHFQSLFTYYFNLKKPQESVITKCKTANAKWKIRPGALMGIKITLRKEKMKQLISFFLKSVKNLTSNLHHDGLSALMFGIKDHRILKLQRYNVKSPDYGMNVIFKFEVLGSRVKYRRHSPCKLNKVITKDMCLEHLQRYVEQ